MRLLAVHGWGFSPAFWEPLRALLPDISWQAVDLGFSGPPTPMEAISAGDEPPLVLAHSLGLAWALANVPRPWAGLVAVNAFTSFCRADDFPAGVAPRVVRRMLDRFVEEPERVSRDFLTRCGVAGPDLDGLLAGLKARTLYAALAWLAACDERAAFAALSCPVLALSGGADPIVSQAMSRACFEGGEADVTHEIVAEGGHLLPLSHTSLTVERLRAFLERIAS
ncbi:hydrolase or acyltransferase [Desulfovibrio sp. X2]|uniref:alpha/beta fold hydrolase n=1 Tax=Desulfovibrio sp. X2 TaxID=941449 RepID=UPI000358DD34|nr:alpha/beta hydrolase [Desulfovibrio sp. X2]EPR41694.1 hydrolase or acyltransferase [Desulfovibrio sp. X2]